MRLWLALFILTSTVCRAEEAATNVPPAATTNAEPTVVTSEQLSVDYAKNIGVFAGNVLVVDPRITVRSDKMTVEFGDVAPTNGTANVTSRTIRKITAVGGVVIVQGAKKATSDEAVYTAADGKVVLTGHPQVESPDGTVSGDKITFWNNQRKMLVESSSRLVIFPEEMKPKDKTEEKKPEGSAP